MSKRSQDEITRAIDVLAKAMPNGQLFAAMGPLPFLGAAADHIAALAASQADATRLAAELAESVRALAVSQGEVERLRGEREGLYGEASYKMLREFHELACGQLAEARGDLERARDHATDVEKALRGVMTFYVPVDHAPGCECQWCVGAFMLRVCDARRETTPTASPEPEDPYCELAASEIPNFGTNRDTHRCAKLHRDKPVGGYADSILDAVDRALAATGPGSGAAVYPVVVDHANFEVACQLLEVTFEACSESYRERDPYAVRAFLGNPGAPQTDHRAPDPTKFEKHLAEARAAIAIVGTGKLRHGELVTEGPRLYVAAPAEPATPPSGSPPGAAEACKACGGSRFDPNPARGHSWPDDPPEACPECGGTGRSPPESPDGSTRPTGPCSLNCKHHEFCSACGGGSRGTR